MMTRDQDSSKQPSSQEERKEVEQFRRRFATGMAIAFAIPAVAIIFLSIMVWRLSVQLNEIRILTDVSGIEMQYRPLKNFGYAVSAYEDLLQRSEHPLAYVRLAELAVAAGELQIARNAIQRAQTDDLPWQLYSTLSYLSWEEDKERDAVEFGERAIQENTCDVQSLNTVAWIYATTKDEKLKNLDKAEEFARGAVECSKGMYPDFLDTLAEVYRREGKLDLAAEQIRKAIEIEEGTSKYLHDRLDELTRSLETEQPSAK